MTPLIDFDVLRYELGFSSEYKDENTGEVIPREWDFVEELIDGKLNFICQHTVVNHAKFQLPINSKDDGRSSVNQLEQTDKET